jgi:phage protein D
MRSLSDPISPFYRVQYRERASKELVDITHLTSALTVTHTGRRRTNKIEVTLDNADQELFTNIDLMRKGTIMTATFGYPGNTVNAGDFTIKEHEPSRLTLSITAHEAKRSSMLRRTRARTFENVRRSDVVRVVLREHGFSNFIGEDTDEKLASVTQTAQETDWEFLERLAKLEHREFYLANDGAHWEIPRRKDKPFKLLRYIKLPIGAGEIKDWTVDSIEAGNPGKIIAKGYNPLTAKSFTVTASDRDTETVKLAESDDITDPDTGDQLASGTTGRDITINVGAVTEKDAKLRIDSIYKEIKYNALKLSLTCIGDPGLRARQILLIAGLGPVLDGSFRSLEAVHTFSGGYTCALKLRRDGLNRKGKKPPQALFDFDFSQSQAVDDTYKAINQIATKYRK